jgi:hypothetical protein
MFSSLSSGVNVRFLFNPVLILSPSNPYDGMPRETRYSSSANETVVFPAPDKPVNQMVHPRNFAPLAPSFEDVPFGSLVYLVPEKQRFHLHLKSILSHEAFHHMD